MNAEVGKTFILPSSFQNSIRAKKKNYYDSIHICLKLGKPTLFVTISCNPNWPEIKNYIKKGKTW